MHLQIPYGFRRAKIFITMNRTDKLRILQTSGTADTDIIIHEDELTMTIGPIFPTTDLTTGASANQNLQTAAQTLINNPDNSHLINLIKVFMHGQSFVYLFPCLQWALLLLCLNTPLPPNFYNLVRIAGSFLLPDISDWEVYQGGYDVYLFATKFTSKDGDTPARIQRIRLSAISYCNLEYVYSVIVLLALANLIRRLINHSETSPKSIWSQLLWRALWSYIEANLTLILISMFLDFGRENEDLGTIKITSMCVSLALLLAFLFGCTWVFVIFRRGASYSVAFQQKFFYYCDGIDLQRKWCIYFHHLMLIKKLLMVTAAVLLHNSFLLQVWTMVGLELAFLVYIIVMKPHK